VEDKEEEHERMELEVQIRWTRPIGMNNI